MRTVCRFGFEMMNLHRIDLTVFDWNTRAIRCYEKVGFQHEGVLRDGMFKAGRWNQLVYMGLLRGELILEDR
jgi:RimJ/RimL family protein N-acetyltransferase